jgi:hypothetical protein
MDSRLLPFTPAGRSHGSRSKFAVCEFVEYTHYVFGHLVEPPKTSSACIFALVDFPVLSDLGGNQSANTRFFVGSHPLPLH